ncbi:MAG: hypothetical protein NTV34_10705 [Proteobacteria bacterium]|nr:hypothetical protein [Pseudomonadota bacterium]
MRSANTKNQSQSISAIFRQIFIMIAVFSDSVCKALIAAAPFILIEDRQAIEFWQAIGYYGIFLIGVAAIYGRFSPSQSRFR